MGLVMGGLTEATRTYVTIFPGHLNIPDIYIVDRLELIEANSEKQGFHIRECDDSVRPGIPDGEFRVMLLVPWLGLDMEWRRTRRVRPFI
jgi:hypothetical protein